MARQFQILLEQYKMIKQEKRMFYPKNFNLSPRFQAALKEEMKLQERAGIDPDRFSQKLSKAMQFLIGEYKTNARNTLQNATPNTADLPVKKEPSVKKAL